MPNLKVLSGSAVVKILIHYGFLIVSQKGSHLKLQRLNQKGKTETLMIY